MPESNPHRDAVDLLRQIVLSAMARQGRDALVAANLGCRWDRAQPQIGVDPDIALIEPPPPEGELVECLCTWKEGHVPPRFAVEVVSRRRRDTGVPPVRNARESAEDSGHGDGDPSIRTEHGRDARVMR